MLSGEDKERVEDLEGQIAKLRTEGRYAEAIAPANEILATRLRVQGSDHWQAADARRLVKTLNQIILKSHAQQEELANADAIETEVKSLLYDPRSKLQVIYSLDLETAGQLRRELEIQLEIRRRLLGSDHQETLRSIHTLGELLEDQGQITDSEPLVSEALEGRRRVLGENHPESIWTLNESNILLMYQYSQKQDDSPYLEAIERSRRMLGDDAAITLQAIYFLGYRYSEQGRQSEAEELVREALDGRRRLLGDDHWQVLTTMERLGLIYMRTGDFAMADVFLQKALAGSRRVLGDEHAATLHALFVLGAVRLNQGRLEEAEQMYREAAEGLRRVRGMDHAIPCYYFVELSVVLASRGKFDEAEPILRDTLENFSRIMGEDHSMVSWFGYILAALVAEQGRLEESEPMYRRAVKGLRRTLGEIDFRTLEAIAGMADLLRALGNFDEAEVLLHEALEGFRRMQGDTHWDVVQSLDRLGFLQVEKGDLAAAEAAWAEAAMGFEALRMRADFEGLERAELSAFRSPLESLAACLAMNGKPLEAWEHYEANLARGLLDTLASRLSRSLNADERSRKAALVGRLNILEERMGALISGGELTGEIESTMEQLRQEQETLQAEMATFKSEIAEKYGVAAGEVYSLNRIQALLDVDTALLGWVDVNDPLAPAQFSEHWACVVKNVGEPVWVRLAGSGKDGSWKEADNELSAQCRKELSQWATGPAIRRRQELVLKLYTQRIEPLEPLLAAIRHLVVLPAGKMAGIPVEALTDEFTISYAPSGTMYAWLKEKSQETAQKNGEAPGLLLALGDPIFRELLEPSLLPEPPDHGVMIAMVTPGSNALRSGLEDGDVLLSYGNNKLEGPVDLESAIRQAQEKVESEGAPGIPAKVWREGETLEVTVAPGDLGGRIAGEPAPEAILAKRRLDNVLAKTRGPSCDPIPYTRLEVETIARLFAREENEIQPTILLGSEASEQRLDGFAATGELEKYSFLHLATHGQMNDRIAMDSALILSQDQLPDAFELAMKGESVFDGRLTAGQIARTWKLDAELVVLSGCETALGKESGGEGFLGFSQALFTAGARSLLLSLWKVDDLATQLLMKRFYENMLGRFGEARCVPGREFGPGVPLPKADALRDAKMWLRNLTREELIDVMAEFPDSGLRGPGSSIEQTNMPSVSHPFQDPHFWAAFILIGNPD